MQEELHEGRHVQGQGRPGAHMGVRLSGLEGAEVQAAAPRD